MPTKPVYLPTGNEYVSLPMIDQQSAGILNINCLYMAYRGLIELHGCEHPLHPFLKPYFVIDKKTEVLPENEVMQWDRIASWIPQFQVSTDDIQFKGTYLCPVEERGFCVHLAAVNHGAKEKKVFIGLRGSWQNAYHTINISKPMSVTRKMFPAAWGGGLMLELARETSILCMGLHSSEELQTESWKINNYPAVIAKTQGKVYTTIKPDDLNPLFWTVGNEYILQPGESKELSFFFGIAVDEVGAITSALEMKRKSYTVIETNTIDWLTQHQLYLNPDKNTDLSPDQLNKLQETMNLNSFFNYFYSMGNCIDNDELVPITSRSPRYYVSAAYWDRDVLYWCFPAVLQMDPAKAKEILLSVFARHNRNVGIHSHYIDGTLLEPGFELDELCAPAIALYQYYQSTGDASLFDKPLVLEGIEHILQILESKRHPQVALYETFLLPSDDPVFYPYVTYDNVLVWKMLGALGEIFRILGKPERMYQLQEQREQIEKAIWQHTVMEHNGKKLFACSVDLKGHQQIYDDPPGSLQLLVYYGFCTADDAIFKATIEHLYSPDYKYSFAGCQFPTLGCDHFTHPSILSVGNDLLGVRKEIARHIILNASMDNGIACESIDEHTGEFATGEAFATCAGYLAYAIYRSHGV